MSRRRLLAAAFAAIVVGALGIGAAFMAPTLTTTPGVPVLVTTAPIVAGESLTPQMARLAVVALPSGLRSGALTSAQTLAGAIAAVNLPAGAILYPGEITPGALAKTVLLPLTFKEAPPLSPGTIVDVFSVTSSSVQLAIGGLVIVSANGSGALVRVPTNEAPSMVYLSSTTLVAVQTVIDGRAVPGTVIQSEAQALASLAGRSS